MSTATSNSTDRNASHGTLFPLPAALPVPPEPLSAGGQARVLGPDRHQIEMQMRALDSLLPEDHQARLVWEYVEGLDLSVLYSRIRSVHGRAGRDAIDPRILMALWLYATLEGVGSARELDRLCGEHVAYQWICGGVSVNYHTLSDFRTDHPELLDSLLTQSVARLMHEDLVTMHRVAQDGVRVRASAGASSFRRRKTLESCLAEAQAQVAALREQLQSDPAGAGQRQQAARERARQDRTERIRRALKEMPKAESQKPADQKDKARVSTTDAQARVMKMADGGFRPAYNVQFATDTQTQIVTGVDVSNNGSDKGQMGTMIQQHNDRYGQRPGEMLVDGGFAKIEDIDSAGTAQPPTIVYAPVPQPRKKGQDPYARRYEDTDAVAQWRQRMSTLEAKDIYRQRGAAAECVNAIARNRGLRQFLVRGMEKVKAIALWFALAHNVIRAAMLRKQAAMA